MTSVLLVSGLLGLAGLRKRRAFPGGRFFCPPFFFPRSLLVVRLAAVLRKTLPGLTVIPRSAATRNLSVFGL